MTGYEIYEKLGSERNERSEKIKYELLYQDLLIQIRNRIPQNSKLVARLVEILSLEKEAVYRRLRREVPFTFEEVVAVAKEFKISLDSVIGIDARSIHPFRLQALDHGAPIDVDYLMLEDYIQALSDLASDPSGEISLVGNLLPQPLYTGFKYIYYFYYFKWRYYSVPAHQTKSYHEIVLPEQLVQMVEKIFDHTKNIPTSHYVLNKHVFQNFVDDVKYFNNIRLVKDEDVLSIKKDLFRLLDYMESIAINGFADTPSNRVYLYISDTDIEASYSYFDSESTIRLSLLWSFIFNSILTFDEKILETIRQWIRSVIRTSTLISVAGGKERTLYFETQRKIVEQL